jgi:PAS domain S-box-containing protein
MNTLENIKAFKHVFDSVHQGIAIFEKNGKIIIYNKVAGSLFKKDPEKMVGRFIKDIFPSAWEDLSAVLNTGKPQIGKQINLEGLEIIANRTPIFFRNKIIGVISLFQDISVHENSLTELETYKQLNELLDTIIESSFDGIWVCDHEGRVIKVNTSSAKMDELPPPQLVGQKMEDLVKQGLIDKSVTLEVIKKKVPVTLVQKARSGKEILVTGNPVFDDNGKLRLVVVNERDNTVLNRLRHELEESRALAQKYRSELSQINSYDDFLKKFVIRSKNMKRVVDRAIKVSKVDSTVLIQGSSGVGKSLLSKFIHQLSNRNNGPLIRVDCGAIPESLIESELFGYEKGAFTGANEKGKPGFFELADSGTLFLDEIGELPLNVQSKILRFLEDNELVRVGGTQSRKIDVRVIAATNRELEGMVKQKLFRKDLFFRLSVVPLHIPPLADRIDDIPALTNHFLKQFNEKFNTNKTIDPQVVDTLCLYHFPGNIRELENLIEQLVVLTPDDHINLSNLPGHIGKPAKSLLIGNHDIEWNLKQAVHQLEKEMIIKAITQYATQAEAARNLGIDQATLSRKIRKLRIKRKNAKTQFS